MSNAEIIVCNNCEHPLIWTFAFPYAEYYCMNEFEWGGMFGTGHRVPSTPKLRKELTLYKRRFGQIRKHIALGKFQRKDCNKCKGNEYHTDHLTEKEKTAHTRAMDKLKEYAGIEV